MKRKLEIDEYVFSYRKEDLKNAILEYSKRLSKYCIFNIIELQDEQKTEVKQAKQERNMAAALFIFVCLLLFFLAKTLKK